jgi:hypothetical protein
MRKNPMKVSRLFHLDGAPSVEASSSGWCLEVLVDHSIPGPAPTRSWRWGKVAPELMRRKRCGGGKWLMLGWGYWCGDRMVSCTVEGK